MVVCHSHSRKRSGSYSPNSTRVGVGGWTTCGDLHLTLGPREIVDHGAFHGLEFLGNPGFFPFPTCGQAEDHQRRRHRKVRYPDPLNPDYLYRGAKYVEKTFRRFETAYGLDAPQHTALVFLEDEIDKLGEEAILQAE